jgi:hypothetical protein
VSKLKVVFISYLEELVEINWKQLTDISYVVSISSSKQSHKGKCKISQSKQSFRIKQKLQDDINMHKILDRENIRKRVIAHSVSWRLNKRKPYLYIQAIIRIRVAWNILGSFNIFLISTWWKECMCIKQLSTTIPNKSFRLHIIHNNVQKCVKRVITGWIAALIFRIKVKGLV